MGIVNQARLLAGMMSIVAVTAETRLFKYMSVVVAKKQKETPLAF